MSRLYPSRLFACDICGKVCEWDANWSSYGSIALDDTCPDEVPTICSGACKIDFETRLQDGRIWLPVLSNHGPYFKVKQHGHGYPVVPPIVVRAADSAT